MTNETMWTDADADLMELLYGIACNARDAVRRDGGNDDWEAAFIRARDSYHAWLKRWVNRPEPRPTPGSPAAAWPPGTPVWYRRYDTGPWEQSVTKTEPWTTSDGVTWVTVESTPAQAGAALRLFRLRTLDNPPPDTELEPPTTPL